MTDCEWPDDNLIDELVNNLVDEFKELIKHSLLGDTGDEVVNAPGFLESYRAKFTVDSIDLLTLSPPQIWESFHVFRPVSGLNYTQEVDEIIHGVADSLNDWEGVAARAFSDHLTNIKSFMDSQSKHVDDAMVSMAAAYKLAIQAREDYKSLVEGWIQVSRDYRAADDQRQRSVALKAGAGVVASVVAIAVEPEIVAAGLAGGASAIGAVVEAYTGTVGGDSAQTVYDSYQRAYNNLLHSYQQELDQLRRFVADRNSDLAQERPKMYAPLPAVCDITGPDFRYENFFDDSTPPGNYSGRVEAERKKLAAEKNNGNELDQNSPISRALNGSSRLGGANHG